MRKALVWFRDNLRVNDNESLAKALAENDQILPVFVVDPAYWQFDKWGHKRTGDIRTAFLKESLQDLQNSLKGIGGDLLVVEGDTEQQIEKIANDHDINTIYAPASFSTNEIAQEHNLTKQFNLNLFWDSSLVHPEDLPFALEKLPDVFTPFRKKIEKYTEIRQTFQAPTKINLLPIDYGFNSPLLKKATNINKPFKGGETEALKRLNYYIWQEELIKTYKETRNGLLGKDYSSKFSPWLALGALSPKHIYWQIKKFEDEIEANQSTYWLIFELFWRDYFKFVSLKFGSSIFKKRGLKPNEETHFGFNKKAFERWRTGTTGEPFVDANMIELLQTGYMSNRGRQNVASYLVHDMGIDWRAGASWFESQLIDYDVCSNYGNWLYVSGRGNDPRPNRKFNIQRQAEMYDPEEKYVQYWLSNQS